MRLTVLVILLALCGATATAQSDDVSSAIQSLAPAEASRLRAILDAPAPPLAKGAELQEYFQQKQYAADRLGDSDAVLAVFRAWEATMPATLAVNNYILELRRAGFAQEALKKREEQLRMVGNGVYAQMYRNNYVGELMDLGRFDDAQRELSAVDSTIATLKERHLTGWNLVYLYRVQSEALLNASRLHSRFGKLDAAIASANQAVQWGRDGYQLAQQTPESSDKSATTETPRAAATLSFALNRSVGAYREAAQYFEAEQALREILQLAKTGWLHAKALPSVYLSAGDLRLDLHEYQLAESHFQKADALAVSQGLTESAPLRITLARMRVLAWEGQHRSADVLAELQRLDALARGDAALARKLLFPFERGYAYLLGQTRAAEAQRLFADIGTNLEKQYSAHHFYIARAHGLQGVALWRMGTASNQEQAAALLDEAVRDYMRPDNLAFETRGVNKDIRDLIFATYLEAKFTRPGENPMDALVPADWVRGGSVQEALSDAAVRSAAATPALMDLVRAEQDARHEIEALRKFLAAEGRESAPSAEIATKMRERIDQLSGSRRRLQADIQARFPDYDRLVRPTPPTLDDMARALAPDEALVMLLPTQEASYVWAVTHDGQNAAVRVDLPVAELGRLVDAIRQTLDFAKMGRRLVPFNAGASSALYQKLLAPLQPALAGKNHLVIAAGGALGQIPFGVLLTQPSVASTADSPWLIRQAAITHVPSLGAWLALKQFAHSAPAPEAFMAWGDPLFASSKVAPSAPGSSRNVVLKRQPASADLEKEAAQSALRYGDIPPLPETRDELLAIASTLHANPASDLHLGEEATKASVLQSSQSGALLKKKVIAFATHGLMAGDLPHLTQPALALAATGRESQDPLGALLTLDEVLNLKLNADWVILSACNTAAADGREEEALSGLARGFFYAGSRSLLVTHWAVESGSAVQLTTRTMASYAAHPAERKSESLRQAMLALMADARYAHPAYWAPYSLVGEGGR